MWKTSAVVFLSLVYPRIVKKVCGNCLNFVVHKAFIRQAQLQNPMQGNAFTCGLAFPVCPQAA